MAISHVVHGTGPHTAILLHGWFGDHEIWSPTYPYLDTERYRYVFVDYRGYGGSRSLSGQFTMEEIATDVIDLADRLGAEHFSLVGHSMGGKAAQRVAVDAGERVQRIIGVTPVPASGVPLPAEVRQMFASVVHDDQAARQVIEGSLGARLTPRLTDAILDHQRQTSDPEAFSAYFRAFAIDEFAAAARSVKCPITVLVGEHDQGVSLEMVKGAFPALYPQVEIEILPNSGHYPMLETPAWLVTRLEHHLARQPS